MRGITSERHRSSGQQSSINYGARLLLPLVLVLLTAAGSLYSQGYFGTVSGEITDPTKAFVPGAQITLVDQKKGYQFTATSDKNGRYVFSSIPPGTYSVSAEMQGFEKAVLTNVTLDVSENVTANLSLKIASSRQAVDVQSQTTSLATEDAVTGQVVNRQFINDLRWSTAMYWTSSHSPQASTT
jgi:Carboxypeptidase regulatory-like domain